MQQQPQQQVTFPQSQSSHNFSSVYLRGQKESTESKMRVGAGVPPLDEMESGEDERVRQFLSSKSQLDPSVILGFDDYLVHTYEDQPQLSSSSLVVAAAQKQQQFAPQCDINTAQHRLMFEAGGTETDETNLLDETSRFVKNLNSGTAWTDFQGCTALTSETVRRPEGILSGHCTEDDFADPIDTDSRQNLTSGRQEQSNNCFVQSGKQEIQNRRSALQELTTNASRNAYNNFANRTAASHMLKQSELIMSGPSFQNESSLFKSSTQNAQNLHQNSSHFITFKPASSTSTEQRNPFPSKVRPAQMEAADCKPATIVETNFLDNVRKESDCYQLPIFEKAEETPYVLSQYSNATSPESGPRAQLTMSQLCPLPQVNSVGGGDIEAGQNFCPGQLKQPKFVVSINQYPNPLGEMPSRIQEESQEFSYSLANFNDIKQVQDTRTIEFEEEQEEEQIVTCSLLNTREGSSQFEMQAVPVTLTNDGVSELNHYKALPTAHDPQNACENADMKEQVGAMAYISDGSNFDRHVIDIGANQRNILSEQQLELILANGEDQTAEQLSKQVFSQAGINPYSTMEEGVGPNQSENHIMLGLARALLKQLNSQRDHFSQETLAQMTSNSQQQLEQATDQISLIEPDEESAVIDEGTSVCSELTEPVAVISARRDEDSVNQSNSDMSVASSAKELYEMRMRDIRKKREQTQPSKVGKKKKTVPHKSRIVASVPVIVEKKVVQKVVKKVEVKPTVAVGEGGDELYRRNMHWKRQIDDINALKKQHLDRERDRAEIEECTFAPTLVSKEPGIGPQNPTNNVDLLHIYANSQCATKSSGPVVEDRCLQWAAHSFKKKQQTQRVLEEISECTFKPTFFAQEFKNRVCPSYDLKHKERVATTTMLTQEFNYFTLKNYLQMNHDSVQDLERLCKLYSSSATNNHNKDQLVGGDQEKGRGLQALADNHNKMLQIAEFITRNDQWLKQVEAKKVKFAEEVTAKREEENTFHPRVDPMSEILHARKLKKLSKVATSNQAAGPAHQEEHKMNLKAVSGGLLETQKKDNLYEYYLPKSKPEKKVNQRKTQQPSAQQAQMKHDKHGNKHPRVESHDDPLKAATIDFEAESRKFSKLIEVLGNRLTQKPGQQRSVEMSEQKRHVISLCQQLLQAQSSGEDKEISFCDNVQLTTENNMDDEVMSAGTAQLIRVFSEQDQHTSFTQQVAAAQSESEETSHFQSIQPIGNKVSPLDLTRVIQHFAQGLLTPTLTDPGHFVGSQEDSIVNQHHYLNQMQLQRLKEEVNLETMSQETHAVPLPYSQFTIQEQCEKFEEMESEADITTTLDNDEQRKSQVFTYEENQIRLIDNSVNSSPLQKQRQVSSSMRKHLDYIYKRKLATSRQDNADDSQAQSNHMSNGRKSLIKDVSQYKQYSRVMTSTPGARIDRRETNCKTQRSARSRSSSSNTDGLFRKRNTNSNSKSKNSRNSSQHSSKVRGMMSSYNIQNMILLEHIPPATANDDTPVRQAKQSLVSEASSQLNVRNDPTICRLAEKLRNLKEREQFQQTRF